MSLPSLDAPIPRSNSMPNFPGGLGGLDNPNQLVSAEELQNLQNVNQSNPLENQPNAVNNQPPPENDQALNNAVVNGVDPHLEPGDHQAEHLAANHEVNPGRDWDMHSAEGMLETMQNSVKHIKSSIAAKESFDSFNESITHTVQDALNNFPNADLDGLLQSFTELKEVMGALKSARAELTAAVKDGSGQEDPNEGIAEIRKTLRVFRFELQREYAQRGHEIGNMGMYEGALREIQHKFTTGVGSKVKETFARIMDLEQQFMEKWIDLRNRLHELDHAMQIPSVPQQMTLTSTVPDVLELSHRTNDQIRDFQDASRSTATLKDILGGIAKKGGSRSVEFSCGVGALIGLGFSKAFVAGLRLGARFRVIGEVTASGKGAPLSVTFRIAGGAEAKFGAKAGEENMGGLEATVTAGGEISHFTTRTYPSLDDLIMDADRCKLATSRTIGGAIWGGIKSLGRAIGALGTTFFRWMGRKSGEVKQNNAQYMDSLKARGVVGNLDGLLAKRANPIITAERKGWTLQGGFKGKIGAELMKGTVDASASGGYTRERDFKVDSKFFTPIATTVRDAKNVNVLNALMRPDPTGGETPPIPRLDTVEDIEAAFDAALAEAKEAAETRDKFFTRTDVVGFARAANKIRTVMLATELAAREGRIPRATADRLLLRFANPSVNFPPDIFREYFMEGSGSAKPAKIRNNASFGVSVSLFSDWSDGLTGDIANPFLQTIAKAGVKEMRNQAGLDQSIKYSFSSEKPAKPGADMRPWENSTYTRHSLTVSASTPARIIINSIVNSVMNKGEQVQKESLEVAKETAKEVAKDTAADAAKGALLAALPGLILTSVKEVAFAAVKKWLSDPENLGKLIVFCIDHAKDAFNFILNTVEWVAEHPDATLQIAASIAGTSSLGESSRSKVLNWDFVDGHLAEFTLNNEVSSTIGVNVDPVGVGVGVGFDISYKVTQSLREKSYCPNPPLNFLMMKGEQFIYGTRGDNLTGGTEKFKNWLSANAMGVTKRITEMFSQENIVKTTELYAQAMLAAGNDEQIQFRLQNAWNTLRQLPADATLDAKVDAMHDFLVPLIMAFRTGAA